MRASLWLKSAWPEREEAEETRHSRHLRPLKIELSEDDGKRASFVTDRLRKSSQSWQRGLLEKTGPVTSKRFWRRTGLRYNLRRTKMPVTSQRFWRRTGLKCKAFDDHSSYKLYIRVILCHQNQSGLCQGVSNHFCGNASMDSCNHFFMKLKSNKLWHRNSRVCINLNPKKRRSLSECCLRWLNYTAKTQGFIFKWSKGLNKWSWSRGGSLHSSSILFLRMRQEMIPMFSDIFNQSGSRSSRSPILFKAREGASSALYVIILCLTFEYVEEDDVVVD